MDLQKIAFIICTDNAQYYEECIRYIQNLKIPENYRTDIIAIQEASSMAQGYNVGMQSSDAKYKVYLHQDTFIKNRNFIYDILRIFQSDSSIGMIGVIGARKLPKNGVCYTCWETGRIMTNDGAKKVNLNFFQDPEKSFVRVEAIDGLIMITQEDITWREDFLDGWDFYDIAQSLEMRRKGYQVVIPYQEEVWCYHDSGPSNVMKYDFYRRKMLKAYPECFEDEAEDTPMKPALPRDFSAICSRVLSLIEAGGYDEICEILQLLNGAEVRDGTLLEIANLMNIYSLEKKNGRFSLWWGLKNWEEILVRYRSLRFILLGVMFHQERKKELEEMLICGDVTLDAVRFVMSVMF